MIYPNNPKKDMWDLFMTIVLIFTCFITPLNISFSFKGTGIHIINYSIDLFYLIDIIVIFNTAIYDD